MSIDNALRAIAYAEAPTLGVAIALIAKHRGELDAAMRAAEIQPAPVTSQGAAEDRALLKLAATSEPPHVVDKTA
jgi:hypothetical protein